MSTELIKAIQISKSHGTQDLFRDVDFIISENDSIALIGPNGSGKTSLIKIIMNEDQPEQGSVIRKKGLKTGYVPQLPDYKPQQDIEEFIIEDLRSVENEMRTAEYRMSTEKGEDLERSLEEYRILTEKFEALGGYGALERCEATIRALGMDNPLDQKLASLSGGELSLLAFARALLCKPDLLILDEPGNHLDYLGLAWLEKFLSEYRGALLIVSHNRYMLDKVSRNLWYIAGGEFAQFTGRYSDFALQQKRDAILQKHDHLAGEKRIAELRKRIKELQGIASASCNPKKTILVQLGAAKAKLERELASTPDAPSLRIETIKLDLRHQNRKSDIALRISDYSKSFGDREILKNISLEVSRGEKIAVVGPNGCGKSVLVRSIVEEGDWNSDRIRIGPSFKVGYLKQKPDQKKFKTTIEEEVRSWGPLSRDDAYNIIKGMQFEYRELDKDINVLSGGESKRLELARLMYLEADFLILDEPTNHMDILSREAIEKALQSFNGTLLIVSHDRYLLDTLVDRVVDLENGHAAEYEGNFTDFFRQKYPVLPRMTGRFHDRGKARRTTVKNTSAPDSAAIERRIEELEAEKVSLDRELTECYRKNLMKEGRELVGKIEKIQPMLDKLYLEWEKLI